MALNEIIDDASAKSSMLKTGIDADFLKNQKLWSTLQYKLLDKHAEKVSELFGGEHPEPLRLFTIYCILQELEAYVDDSLQRLRKKNSPVFGEYMRVRVDEEIIAKYLDATPIKMLEGNRKLHNWFKALQKRLSHLKPLKAEDLVLGEGFIDSDED
jgi:hypothetical protein